MRHQSSQPWRKREIIRRGFVVSFRRTEMRNYCDLKSVSLKQLVKFFSDLINIISLNYSIKRGIEVI